ncbi:MAG: hypothetical protein EA350_08305 [Gemmatimonadales bacterium]|nr:MAG: hypothetical protein EA350_08305 [Gemmatimonadales bacterium]
MTSSSNSIADNSIAGTLSRRLSLAPRLPALALAAFLGLGLAACGGDGDLDSPAAQDQQGMEQPIPGQSPQDPAAQMDPAAMALVMEAQEIQQRLATLGEQVMADPEVAQQLETLQERIETAMREEAPELIDEMQTFQAEHAAATQAGDQERAQQIELEAQQAQAELQRVQQVVLERPAIAAEIEAFEETQRERMIAIDPEAGELLDRLEEIRLELGMP